MLFLLLSLLSAALPIHSALANPNDCAALLTTPVQKNSDELKSDARHELQDLKTLLLKNLAADADTQFKQYRSGTALSYLNDNEIREYVKIHNENNFNVSVRKICRALAKLAYLDAFNQPPDESTWSVLARSMRVRASDKALRNFHPNDSLDTFKLFTKIQIEAILGDNQANQEFYALIRAGNQDKGMQLKKDAEQRLRVAEFDSEEELQSIRTRISGIEEKLCCGGGACFSCPRNYPLRKQNNDRKRIDDRKKLTVLPQSPEGR